MKKLWMLLGLLITLSIPAAAQTGALEGFCDQGGRHATTSGLNASNFQQGDIPSCTITVYLTGTTTLATLYSDKNNTPLANPFTANDTTSVFPGHWIFWASNTQAFDVIGSGGISPNTYPAPVPLCTDCFPSSQFTVSAGVNSAEGITPVAVNGVFNTPEQGDINISCPDCDQLGVFTSPPISGQHIIVYPVSVTTSGTCATANTTSGQVTWSQACNTEATDTWAFNVSSLTALGIPIGNVTAVYPFIVSGVTVQNTAGSGNTFLTNCSGTGVTLNNTRGDLGFHTSVTWPLTQFTSSTSLTVSTGNFNAMTCEIDASFVDGGVGQPRVIAGATTLVGAYVYYTGSPVTQPSQISVKAPLNYNSSNGTLSLPLPFDAVPDFGTANTYAVTSSSFTQAVSGLDVKFYALNASTSATPTLNVNGWGAWTIVGPCGSALASGDISAYSTSFMVTDVELGGNNQWILKNPQVNAGCGGGGAVSSVSNSDGSLTISPTTGAVVGSINYAHAGTWSALETFSTGVSAAALTLSAITGSTQCLHVNTSGVVSGTGSDCGSGGGSGLTVGSTTISGGTSGNGLYDNVGVLGEKAFAPALGNCTAETTNFSAAAASCYVGNAGSGITATLPSITTGAIIRIQNINTGTVTASFGSNFNCTLNGTTTSTTTCAIANGSTGVVTTDGTSWYVFVAPSSSSGGASISATCPVSNATNICIASSPYNGSSSGATTTTGTFSASATSGTVGSCSTFNPNQGVYIAGGGGTGANLSWDGTGYVGTVVSCSGTTMTITPAITNSVAGATVQHDESVAFNSAMTALNSAGGGTIWVPDGKYLLNGPLQDPSGSNSILPVPVLPNYTGTPIHIEIAGFGTRIGAPPNLVSGLTTSGASFIGGFDGATGGGFPDFTNVILTLSNISIGLPTPTSAVAVNATWILGLIPDNLSVSTPASGIPTTGAGVLFPTISNNVRLGSGGILVVSGFNTCVRAGEHQTSRNIIVSHCTNGVVFNPASTSSGTVQTNSIHVDHIWCGPPDGIGNSYIANCIVGGATEGATIDLPDVDYEGNGTLISDSANLLSGRVGYKLPDTACPTGATVTGGTNLVKINLQCTSGGISTATQGSTTAGHVAVIASDGHDIVDGGTPTTGAMFNITGTVTASGCTVSGGVCTVGTAGNSITFSSIPGTYNSLILVIQARGSDASLNTTLGMQFNSDTGSNYDWQSVAGEAAVAAATAGSADVNINLANIAASTASANVADIRKINIPNYAGTTFFKEITASISCFWIPGTTSDYRSILMAGLWRSTSSITAIKLYDVGGGNIVVGSTFSIYGVN